MKAALAAKKRNETRNPEWYEHVSGVTFVVGEIANDEDEEEEAAAVEEIEGGELGVDDEAGGTFETKSFPNNLATTLTLVKLADGTIVSGDEEDGSFALLVQNTLSRIVYAVRSCWCDPLLVSTIVVVVALSVGSLPTVAFPKRNVWTDCVVIHGTSPSTSSDTTNNPIPKKTSAMRGIISAK
jgi:hypothetical protein